MATDDEAEVIDVDTFRPVADRHTMLRPGQAVPTMADTPTYSEADFRISQETADLLDASPLANTGRTARTRTDAQGLPPPGKRAWYQRGRGVLRWSAGAEHRPVRRSDPPSGRPRTHRRAV